MRIRDIWRPQMRPQKILKLHFLCSFYCYLMKLVEEEVSRVLNLFFQLIFHVVRCYSNTVQDLFNGQENLYHFCECSTALTPAILLHTAFLLGHLHCVDDAGIAICCSLYYCESLWISWLNDSVGCFHQDIFSQNKIAAETFRIKV